MDTPAYSLPVMYQITQLSRTRRSVITLGHSPEQPLIDPPSELSYGFEPHGHIGSTSAVAGSAESVMRGGGVGRGVPGVGPGWVGTGWVLYRVLTQRLI